MKPPPLIVTTGAEAKVLRTKLGLNQSQFWHRLAISQSAGSRCENGRALSEPVAVLLHLAYASEKQAAAMLAYLRRPQPKETGGPRYG